MKFNHLFPALLFTILLTSCAPEAFELALMPAANPQLIKANHSKAQAIQEIMDEYTRKGLPGVAVALKDAEGVWEGASGYAKIETTQKLTPGFVHIGASLTKIYCATAIMLLKEQQKINLDTSITKYLPEKISSRISRSNEITVRMLLNHTSGIPDHLENNLAFKLKWFNNFSKGWTTVEALAEAYNKPLLFNPGSQFSYANNNYVLLSLIIEHVTGQPEGVYIQKNILDKLNLQHTYYKTQPGYLDKLPMPNYYLDRYGDGRFQNITAAAKAEISSELGDGGLVATPVDFVSFMDALATGKLVSEVSLAEMKQFNAGEYGLGLQNGFNYQKKIQYGHLGSVVGGEAIMLYFEEQKAALYITCNMDCNITPWPTVLLYYDMRNKIADYLANQ